MTKCLYTVVRSGKSKGKSHTYDVWCEPENEQLLLSTAMNKFSDFEYMTKAVKDHMFGKVILPAKFNTPITIGACLG